MRRIVLSSAAFLLSCANLLAAEVQVGFSPSPKPKLAQSPKPQQYATATPQGSPGTQTIKPADVSRYRPALLGTGPNSLVNRINTQELIKKGQKNASIMFCCSVKNTGEIASA